LDAHGRASHCFVTLIFDARAENRAFVQPLWSFCAGISVSALGGSVKREGFSFLGQEQNQRRFRPRPSGFLGEFLLVVDPKETKKSGAQGTAGFAGALCCSVSAAVAQLASLRHTLPQVRPAFRCSAVPF